jgi:hypothetical protein
MNVPITGMLRYLEKEAYDRVVFLYDRHHLPLFRAAGVNNLFWFPGLTFPHDDSTVLAASKTSRSAQIAFVGQAQSYHPRRGRLLSSLKASQLPLQQSQVGQRDALRIYGSSLIGFNASLNGDLNLRAFEVMSSGAMLLTDRLGAGSGIDLLWTEGRELCTYGSEEELLEKARHYSSKPDEARAIGKAGAKWFASHLGQSRRRAAFEKLALNGEAVPEFDVGPMPALAGRLLADPTSRLCAFEWYEVVQELHRRQETVSISADEQVQPDLEALCSTLPRLQVKRTEISGHIEQVDWSVTSVSQSEKLDKSKIPPCLWFWDAKSEDAARLKTIMAQADKLPLDNHFSLFTSKPSASVEAVMDKGALAHACLIKGDIQGAFSLAQTAMAETPGNLDAIIVLGEILYRSGKFDLAAKFVKMGVHLNPNDERIRALHRKLPSHISSVG